MVTNVVLDEDPMFSWVKRKCCYNIDIGCGEGAFDFPPRPNEGGVEVMVDVRSGVVVHPCLQHCFIEMRAKSTRPTFVSDGDDVCEILLLDVDFDCTCEGDGDFTLGGGEGILSSRLSSLKDLRFA
uniref:Uncharacterized protein n=1 Tax=Tanacetum cinerariifolium TaxID=118510 RepID=A0A6L2NNS1_TANCI|nr:hypothetical protein [Tanacetum cinerariifolium]